MNLDGASMTPAPGGQGAETTPDWLGALPETLTVETKDEAGQAKTVALRDHPKMREFKDVGALAKSYLEQQRALGKKTIGLVKPGPDASPEEQAAFQKELRGVLDVPESPDGYQLQVAEGTAPDDPFLTLYKTWGHGTGVPPKAMQELYDGIRQASISHWEALGKAELARNAQAVEALAKAAGVQPAEWVEQAKRGFDAVSSKLGVDEAKRKAFMDAHGDDPTVLEVFSGLGRLFKEDTLEGSGGVGVKQQQSPEAFYKSLFHDA